MCGKGPNLVLIVTFLGYLLKRVGGNTQGINDNAAAHVHDSRNGSRGGRLKEPRLCPAEPSQAL